MQFQEFEGLLESCSGEQPFLYWQNLAKKGEKKKLKMK
jgi:hypothetical protein